MPIDSLAKKRLNNFQARNYKKIHMPDIQIHVALQGPHLIIINIEKVILLIMTRGIVTPYHK